MEEVNDIYKFNNVFITSCSVDGGSSFRPYLEPSAKVKPLFTTAITRPCSQLADLGLTSGAQRALREETSILFMIGMVGSKQVFCKQTAGNASASKPHAVLEPPPTISNVFQLHLPNHQA